MGRIERFCDDVAGEFLLPDQEIAQFNMDDTEDFETIMRRINKFATDRNLSSSMVAYKLYRRRMIDQTTWAQLRGTFRQLWLNERTKKRLKAHDDISTGPNYYVVRQHRVGRALINFVGRMMDSGAITTSKAGKVLGVKPQNVQTLVEFGRAM